MKNTSREDLNTSRPNQDAVFCLDFILEQLYQDKKTRIEETITADCRATFEELIGAILKARDEIKFRRQESMLQDLADALRPDPKIEHLGFEKTTKKDYRRIAEMKRNEKKPPIFKIKE
jgi:hypothetical protein